MAKIVAIVNQKGGVGKTTTCVNLTAALKEAGKRVLLCDFDPQANATSGLGINKRKLKNSVYDVVVNELSTRDAIVSTKFGDVLPATADLAGAAVELLSMPEPNQQLKKALFPIGDIEKPRLREMAEKAGLYHDRLVRLCHGYRRLQRPR